MDILPLAVEHDGAPGEAGPQLGEVGVGAGGHEGFAPPLAAVLHILLELDPAADLAPLQNRCYLVYEFFTLDIDSAAKI